MAVAKKDRFVSKDLKTELGMSVDFFPPSKFEYHGKILYLLGSSNKNDLYPTTIEDVSIHRAVLEEQIDQYIYTSEDGSLYDALIYVDEANDIILGGIRTRDLP